MYYSLHNHTCASNQRLIDSINGIEDLIQYAFDLGLYGVAMTQDGIHLNLFWVTKFIFAAMD